MKTVRLTMAQAMVRFLENQYSGGPWAGFGPGGPPNEGLAREE